MLRVIMLNIIMLNVIMLNVIMLNVIMLNVIMLNIITPSVVAPYAEFSSVSLKVGQHLTISDEKPGYLVSLSFLTYLESKKI